MTAVVCPWPYKSIKMFSHLSQCLPSRQMSESCLRWVCGEWVGAWSHFPSLPWLPLTPLPSLPSLWRRRSFRCLQTSSAINLFIGLHATRALHMHAPARVGRVKGSHRVAATAVNCKWFSVSKTGLMEGGPQPSPTIMNRFFLDNLFNEILIFDVYVQHSGQLPALANIQVKAKNLRKLANKVTKEWITLSNSTCLFIAVTNLMRWSTLVGFCIKFTHAVFPGFTSLMCYKFKTIFCCVYSASVFNM